MSDPQDDALHQDQIETPAEKDEDSVSGTEPTPDSDDNVDKMTDEVGLYDNSEVEPVGIAEQVEKDEKALKDIPPEK